MNKDSSAPCCRVDGSVICHESVHMLTCIISITVGATKKLAVLFV